MPQYSYTAEREGHTFTATTTAKDRFEIYQKVRAEGATLVSISTIGESFIERAYRALARISTVPQYDVIIFVRTLAAMLSAGLPLSRALAISEKQTKNGRLKSVVSELSLNIRAGETLHTSLEKHPFLFSKLFIAMAKSGEESGTLPLSLETVGNQLEKMYRLRKQVRGALMYPGVIVVAMLGVSIVMLTQVVPTLKATFEDVGVALPTSTQTLIAVSDALSNHTLLVILGTLTFISVCYAILHSKIGVYIFDRVITRTPIIGGIVVEINTARTARTLASLVTSGVDVIRAIEITSEVVQNTLFKAVLQQAEEVVVKGSPLSITFTEKNTVFPALFGEMIAVGEETGQMSEMLNRLAVYYENEVEQKTKNLSTILEPVLMLFIGTGVGFFAMSMITPIYSLSESI
jgi:type IV pilus assembly protein PilC